MRKSKAPVVTVTASALKQREALDILASLDKKPIIAIDLDYTVSFIN